MVQLPPPSFDPAALLPMPGRAARLARSDGRAEAGQLIGQTRALPTDGPKTGLSMLSLRAGGAPKKRRC